ncbi:uncharacterized protein LOC144057466 [Vanacampus margaritifer]
MGYTFQTHFKHQFLPPWTCPSLVSVKRSSREASQLPVVLHHHHQSGAERGGAARRSGGPYYSALACVADSTLTADQAAGFHAHRRLLLFFSVCFILIIFSLHASPGPHQAVARHPLNITLT